MIAGGAKRPTHLAAVEPTISLAGKVAFLSLPQTYGRASVTVRETRTSWVFLTADRVYKLKKPIVDKDLDFRSLTARGRNAMEEVRLNSRLAGGVYVGVQPLSLQPDGRLCFSPDGLVVDWLVVMRRLPEPRFLDEMIAAGTVTDTMIQALGVRLAEFYRSQPPVPLSVDATIEQFAEAVTGTRDALLDRRLGIDAERADRIASGQLALLKSHATEIGGRVEAGVFREGHGDLRPEHVSLIDPPVIIDCLEFAWRYRVGDPFDEIGYLALECERLGAAWIGQVLFEALRDRFGHAPSDGLLAFYRSYRAWHRAYFALRHFLDPRPREAAKWRPLAERYLRMAEAAIA